MYRSGFSNQFYQYLSKRKVESNTINLFGQELHVRLYETLCGLLEGVLYYKVRDVVFKKNLVVVTMGVVQMLGRVGLI